MKIFVVGLVLGGLVAWGIFATLDEDPLPGPGPARPAEDPGAARVPVPPAPMPDETIPPVVGSEPDAFAPGTAVLRIGDGYVFGRDRATRDPGDLYCQDIRHGASLRCAHGTLPVDVPLGATGLPDKPAELAALVTDAPTDLPQRDAWVLPKASAQAPGVALVRSAAGKTYKVWLVRYEPHADALRRRVHLAYAQIPVRAGGGVVRVSTSAPVGAGGATQTDLRRIVAAGRAVPGDSFSGFLQGTYSRLTSFPEKLDLRKRRFILADDPLSTEVTFRSGGGLYAHGGIGPKGKVVLSSYSGVAVRGAMEGVVDVKSYGYVHIDGDLEGDLNINSYATVVIDGDIVGTLKVRSYTDLLLRGRILGKLDAKGSCWSTFYFDGYFSHADLVDLGGSFGSVTLHVRQSDLAIGKHKEIGTWREVIVGDPAWKKIEK